MTDKLFRMTTSLFDQELAGYLVTHVTQKPSLCQMKVSTSSMASYKPAWKS